MKQILISVLISVFLAVVGSFLIQPLANRFWLTPFDPKIVAGPYIWSLALPAEGFSFSLVSWLTFANEGETPGTVQNLKFHICLPKGDWVIHPSFVVDGKRYFEMFQAQKYDLSLWGEPFTPIYLPAKSQTTRSILFMPRLDFVPTFIAPGDHKVTLSAQWLNGKFVDVWTGGFSVSKDEIDQLRRKPRHQIRRLMFPSQQFAAPLSCPR